MRNTQKRPVEQKSNNYAKLWDREGKDYPPN